MPQATRSRRKYANKPAISNQSPARNATYWFALVAVAAITFAVFARTIGFQFVNWDDNNHVATNPWFNPTVNIGHFWTASYENLYIPFSYSVWGLLAEQARTHPLAMAGYHNGEVTLNPLVFHLATVILHVVNASLVFVLLRRLFKNDLACGAGALLFAIHPMQVESVAWVSEMRGTLSTAFALTAVLAFLSGHDQRAGSTGRIVCWVSSTVLYVAALLSKPGVVTLPIIVLLIDCLILKRPIAKSIPLMSSWLVVAGIIIWKTQNAQPVPDDLKAMGRHGLITASDALGFYLAKLFLPIHLGVDYGRTPSWLMQQPWYLASIVTLIGVGGLIALCWKRLPVISSGLSVFVVALLPVLGLVPFIYQTYSTVADRYVYLAMLGPAIIAAWFLDRSIAPAAAVPDTEPTSSPGGNLPGRSAAGRVALVVAGVCLGLFAFLSFQQTGYWRDSGTLFRHAVSVNPRSYPSYNNLGQVEDDNGNEQEAIKDYRVSTELAPDYGQAYVNLGLACFHSGQQTDAIDAFKKALSIDSDDPDTHNSLGTSLGLAGRLQEARDEFSTAVEQDPKFVEAYQNLTVTDYKLKRYDDAIDAASKTIQLDANDEPAHSCLYLVYSVLGRKTEAANELAIVQSLTPNGSGGSNSSPE